MSEQEPTPDEIERVHTYEKQQRAERWAAEAAEREAKVAAHVERITAALIDERILEVEVEDMDAFGEINTRNGYLKLTFASGRVLTVSIGGWSETYLDVEISDG